MRPLAPGLELAPAVSLVALAVVSAVAVVVVEVVLLAKGERSSAWCRWRRSCLGLVVPGPVPIEERAVVVVALGRVAGAARASPGVRNLSTRSAQAKAFSDQEKGHRDPG